jgi:predicted RNA-binding Zn-ribbon protein involved in translation (DUF1610 family)
MRSDESTRDAPAIHRCLVCELTSPLPPPLSFPMQDFRLMLNRGVKHALESDITPRGSMVKFGQSLASEHNVNGAHARTAMSVALSLAKGHRRRGRGRRMRRRLSSWPQRELHRQIEYEAEERGVPTIQVDPRYTSKTCPRCGEVKERRSRVGRAFDCDECGWRLDRQLNAG